MLYRLHYFFVASGLAALNILLGVYIKTYTDANSFELGVLLMLMPFTAIIFRPIICSAADRKQEYQKYIMYCQLIVSLSYSPFLIIPFLGPEVYVEHARICWYILLVSKVIGDIAFGGMISIGDALAINYAMRLGTDFGIYRMWGTISWMSFGLIIGQINEIWFLPKYVPAFMILVLSSLLDMTVIWLWPKEYFVMVSVTEKSNVRSGKQTNEKGSAKEETVKKGNQWTKSLLPKEIVWSHAKSKLLWLFSFGFYQPLVQTEHGGGKRTSVALTLENDFKDSVNNNSMAISKTVQLKILRALACRDRRIVLYLMLFICTGFSVAPVSYWFISLAEICHTGNACDFSQLTGFLQVAMCIIEIPLYMNIKRLVLFLGRLQLIAIGLCLVTIKYFFYATIWHNVDPYYSILAELCHGLSFGIYLTMTVEMGHVFANEVEFILDDLIENNVIDKDLDRERLKISLAATMQSLVVSAQDGIGRGFGALVYGLLLEYYSYETLWLIVGIGAAIVSAIVFSVNMFDNCFHPEIGLALRKSKEEGHIETGKVGTTMNDGNSAKI